jgi:hypothetical protein
MYEQMPKEASKMHTEIPLSWLVDLTASLTATGMDFSVFRWRLWTKELAKVNKRRLDGVWWTARLRTQNPSEAIPWGFDSPSRHQDNKRLISEMVTHSERPFLFGGCFGGCCFQLFVPSFPRGLPRRCDQSPTNGVPVIGGCTGQTW